MRCQVIQHWWAYWYITYTLMNFNQMLLESWKCAIEALSQGDTCCNWNVGTCRLSILSF